MEIIGRFSVGINEQPFIGFTNSFHTLQFCYGISLAQKRKSAEVSLFPATARCTNVIRLEDFPALLGTRRVMEL